MNSDQFASLVKFQTYATVHLVYSNDICFSSWMRTVTGRSNTTKGQGELKRPYRGRLPPLREPIKEPNLVPINQSTWIRKYRGAYINEDINTCPFILYKACIRDFVRHSSMSKKHFDNGISFVVFHFDIFPSLFSIILLYHLPQQCYLKQA